MLNNLVLENTVGDLKGILLDLDDLRLVVEVGESVDEVEVLALVVELVQESAIEPITEDIALHAHAGGRGRGSSWI